MPDVISQSPVPLETVHVCSRHPGTLVAFSRNPRYSLCSLGCRCARLRGVHLGCGEYRRRWCRVHLTSPIPFTRFLLLHPLPARGTNSPPFATARAGARSPHCRWDASCSAGIPPPPTPPHLPRNEWAWSAAPSCKLHASRKDPGARLCHGPLAIRNG